MTENGKKNGAAPLIEARNVTKLFGRIIALNDVSFDVYPGEVTCLLGDNGAGKSTLIKLFSGVYQPDDGEILFEGQPVQFHSPRDARAFGIATVYQDLALVPMLSVWRNFFLGSEPEKRLGPLRRYDIDFAKQTVLEEMGKMGIDIRDPGQEVGSMSGGERQSLAIARAIYFGAKVLILDEPTASLGVKQSGTVLRFVAEARQRDIGIIFITHNPSHADVVGDTFTILKRGRVFGTWRREETSLADLIQGMSGQAELESLKHEIDRITQRSQLN
ncbi:MAG: ATP-binding cassette domain-containing protein [Chloroflexi bacterium]|nr:ATP-binding cassette domain-containing protein [Anaerolineaceae bacterium]MCY4106753.1 ATP-binding cassette domain-containing protein [Chloroflexota bacterium]